MPIVPTFQKAKRQQAKASIVIEGLSGSGKSGAALMLAHGLTQTWDTVAAVDTESNSLQLYVDVTLSSGVRLGSEQLAIGNIGADDGYKPSHFQLFRNAAISQGYKALIIDSMSHMWQYSGGILDIVNKLSKSSNNNNKYAIWGDPSVTAEKAAIMDLIRHPKLHCINTVRTKEKMETVTEDGKTKVKSLGEQQIMMPDFKYEPDLILKMEKAGKPDGTPPKVTVLKSRYGIFVVDEEYELTANLIEQLRSYLEEGTSPEELIEQQRLEYVEALTKYLDENANARSLLKPIKEQLNIAPDVKLKDMSLKELKGIFSSVVI